MNYINLCPHVIVIMDSRGGIAQTIPPSGVVARCAALKAAGEGV
jgi:hypothetical protein